jgi:hypothetical protein
MRQCLRRRGPPWEPAVQAFYVFAALYLAIGLVTAARVPGRAARPGLRAQIQVSLTVLGAGLFWPDRWRARFDPFSF